MTNRFSRRSFLAACLAATAMPALADGANRWAPRRLEVHELERLNAFLADIRHFIPEITRRSELVEDHVRVRLPEDQLFRSRTADLHQDGVRLLTLIAERMLARNLRMEAVGHHHSDGQSYRSFIISQRRAQAVTAAMQSRQVPPALLLATGLGENFPLQTNATPAGREANRRIELLFRPA